MSNPNDTSSNEAGAREHAPAITIDTGVSSTPSPNMASEAPQDAAASPSSPATLSSPVASTRAFLDVPKAQHRKNSIDNEDGFTNGGTTVHGSDVSTKKHSEAESETSNAFVMNNAKALKPDAGKEITFKTENNPFAFSPGQLNKMFDPKTLSAFYALGGLQGIAKGLRTDLKAGLNPDESKLEGDVSFEKATEHKLVKTALPTFDIPADQKPAHSGDFSGSFADRKRIFSDNRLPEKKGKSLWQIMWITYNDKVLILLTIAAIVSLAIGLYEALGIEDSKGIEWVEGVAIIAAIAIVVVVGSVNDYQKERQFAKLNRKKSDRMVKVVRCGQMQEILVYDILVGDVVHLEPGDMVPVDGILIEGFNVKCDESQATGESDIIKKTAGDVVFEAIENNGSLKKLDPFIQSGARIMEGVGTFVCTSTGVHSSYGRTMMSLDEEVEMTPLQGKLNVIATYIAKIGGAAGLLLFIILFIKFLAHLPKNHASPAAKAQNFLDIFIVVVTVIVVAVPEGLPLAVTLALAFATTRMLKDNNLVRHLKACEVMGNATAICSDKTGTLTQNKMQVVAGTVGTSHRFGKGPEGEEDAAGIPEFASSLSAPVKKLLVDSIAINSTAFEGEVDGAAGFVGSKTETALLMLARDNLGMGVVSEERANANIIQIVPFDSGRKCMAVMVKLPTGGARLYVKGASEIVLGQCKTMVADPTVSEATTELSGTDIHTITTLIEAYASRSLRTIGLAYRDFPDWTMPGYRRVEDSTDVNFGDMFHDMTLLSVVGIQDPLRPGVPEAVALCQKAGVTVRMVTGDNKITAAAISKECGILREGGVVLEGPEFRNMSKSEQFAVIPDLCVLARSSPEDKRILVKRLKEQGEIVAVTGDGTNDAPALKGADVGFSMGIAGTEVAKEASAIILMDDNFTSIINALKWGRAVNDAVKKFLQFQLTVNVTAVLLTFISSIASDEEASVLTAVQLLWVNLIMDTLAALALATDPPSDSILDRKPEPRGSFIISLTMWKMILGQALYQIVVTLVLYFGRDSVLPNATPAYNHDEVATLVFNTFVWMQIFNQWNNRRLDNGWNIFEGISRNPLFLGINVAMCGLQVLIIFVAGPVFDINDKRPGASSPQDGYLWAIAIVLGFLSIPFGMVIRLVPDSLVSKLVPAFVKKRFNRPPNVTVSDEEAFTQYPAEYQDIRDELEWIKRIKGGRLNSLKFAIKHPRQRFTHSRSSSHSRASSMTVKDVVPPVVAPENAPQETEKDKESKRKSKSARSRANSSLGAPTVMAGIVAAGIAASWSPVEKREDGERREDDE